MGELGDKKYVIVVQCHITKEVCGGYFCERAFTQRADGFAPYAENRELRINYITCGGCCGKATHRKLCNLIKQLAKDGIQKPQIAVQLASCMTKDNYHSPRCPHVDYIKAMIARLGLDCREDTRISKCAQKRRDEGLYQALAD